MAALRNGAISLPGSSCSGSWGSAPPSSRDRCSSFGSLPATDRLSPGRRSRVGGRPSRRSAFSSGCVHSEPAPTPRVRRSAGSRWVWSWRRSWLVWRGYPRWGHGGPPRRGIGQRRPEREEAGAWGRAHGHGQHLYDEALRVPLIVKPAGPPRPERRSALVSLVDVAPTVLELPGMSPDALGGPGRSRVDRRGPRSANAAVPRGLGPLREHPRRR